MDSRTTQVAIVGAGPAGLMLSHLLARGGIESVVLEARSRDYVEHRVRAGVLEHPTVELLIEVGLGDRLQREGMRHDGVLMRFGGADHRIDFRELTGRWITVYGQQEVVKDLIAARLAAGGEIVWEADAVAVHDFEGDGDPSVTWQDANGDEHRLECSVIAGCDGFHGICRPSIPAAALRHYDKTYPFAWLGILAKAAPRHEELVYCRSERGFALCSMRSPEITRLYLQVPPDEDIDAWPDDRIWAELQARLTLDGTPAVNEGSLIEKGITAMRSFVVEPMQCGRLFLAGDAAHIVPATGAKGMNLAIADVAVLAAALGRFFARGDAGLLDAYSDRCLRRVWRAEHFSWWMTSMLHRFPGSEPFDDQLQLSQLQYVTSSPAGATSLAENYVGLPFSF